MNLRNLNTIKNSTDGNTLMYANILSYIDTLCYHNTTIMTKHYAPIYISK